MSVDEFYMMRRIVPRGEFNELDLVVLTADVMADGRVTIPAGTLGTIVAAYENGSEFEVEFVEPEALATVNASLMRAAPVGA